jgi:hypothetical protein
MTTDNDDDEVTAVAYVTKEFTFIDPLSHEECHSLIVLAKSQEIDAVINNSGRIVLFATDDLTAATAILSELGLIESIGYIREITEWSIVGLQPEYKFDITFTPESDNDG